MEHEHPARPQQPDAGFDEGLRDDRPDEEPDFARGLDERGGEPEDDFAKGLRSGPEDEEEGSFATGMDEAADPGGEGRDR